MSCRYRPVVVSSNVSGQLSSFNVSKRSISGSGDEKPKKKKESEITFSPLVPSDKFLERRKKNFYEKFASEEGKTGQFNFEIQGGGVPEIGCKFCKQVVDRCKNIYRR